MILNICTSDWSNYMHNNANSLRSVGVDCIDLKKELHSCGYLSQSSVADDNRMIEAIKKADVVQIFHSDLKVLQLFKRHNEGAKLVVYHTGTAYRNEPNKMNEAFYDAINLTDQTEFIQFNDKIKYVATAIDTDYIVPIDKTRAIGHYPSNAGVKGTEQIREMLRELDIPVHISTEYLNHDLSLDRMGQCEVYVELFQNKLNGRDYGCYGVTAFEAAAMGCVVVTQNLFPDVYVSAYGSCPFYLVNSKDDFTRVIKELSAPDTNINLLGMLARRWVVEKHSYKASGEYLKKILGL